MKIIQLADFHGIETGHPSENIPDKLRERGHDVKVYTSDLFKSSLRKDYPIETFRGVRIGNKAIYPTLIPKLLFRENPDVIHTWVMGFFSTFVSGWLKPLKKYPLVVSADFDVNEKRPPKIKAIYEYLYRKKPTALADVVTTFTQKEKEVLVERFGFERQKIKILPIGIDFKAFSSLKKTNLRKRLGIDDKFILLDVCFLSPKKNIEMILKAMEKLPENFVFIHAGGISDIDYKQKLDRIIKTLGLEKRVIFLGGGSKEKIISAYHTADVFVQSGFTESFCIPIIEAMSSGLPVVTTKVGVAFDVVKDNETGFIVKNEDEIVSKINLLRGDAALRKRIGKNTQNTAKGYDWENVIDKLEKIYKSIIR